MQIESKKLNESFYAIDVPNINVNKAIAKKLSVPIKNARFDPMVQAGLKPDHETFFRMHEGKMIIPIGVMPFLRKFNVPMEPEVSEYTEQEILDFIESLGLPFDLYKHQIDAIIDSLLKRKQMVISCTGSGKSAIVSIISAFLTSKGKKGLILVPGIGLVTQIHADILDYNLQGLYDDTHLIGGDHDKKHFDRPLTISTWQSVRLFKERLPELDFLLVDECLHPNTHIKTETGTKKIIDIKADDIVLTINEKTGVYEHKKVIKLHKNISNEPLYCINNELKITGNHKVLTTKGWKRTDELKINDRILSHG